MKPLRDSKPVEGKVGSFNERQRPVVEYTDAMTLKANVSDAALGAVGSHFDEKQMLELTTSIAEFNSRKIRCRTQRGGEQRLNGNCCGHYFRCD